jgi:hypothetical protein
MALAHGLPRLDPLRALGFPAGNLVKAFRPSVSRRRACAIPSSAAPVQAKPHAPLTFAVEPFILVGYD